MIPSLSGRAAAFVLASLFGMAGAKAAFINGTSTGLPGPATTVTFSTPAVANNSAVTNQFAQQGVSFSRTLYYSPEPQFWSGVVSNDQAASNGQYSVNNAPVTLGFAGAVMGAAFAMSAN